MKLLIFKKVKNGITSYTYSLGKYDGNTVLPSFVCQQSNVVVEGIQYVKSCNLMVVVTGDLTWYTATLGKVNMSGICVHGVTSVQICRRMKNMKRANYGLYKI